MRFRRFKYSLLLIPCLSAWFLSGCNAFNQLNVHSGEFDVYAPPVFTGAGYNVKKDTSVNRASLQIKLQKEKRLQLHDVWNKKISGDDRTLPEEKANIAYRLKNFPVTASYDRLIKSEVWLATLGGGLDPFPYLKAYTGWNSNHFEFGIGFQLGFGKYKYSLEGDWLKHCHTFEGEYDCGYDHLSQKDQWDFSFTALLSTYIGVFLTKELALTYAPAIYFPWWSTDSFDEHDITFSFPFIIEQYMGVSYLLNERIQFSLGATVYVGQNFAGKHWQVDTGIGYLF